MVVSCSVVNLKFFLNGDIGCLIPSHTIPHTSIALLNLAVLSEPSLSTSAQESFFLSPRMLFPAACGLLAHLELPSFLSLLFFAIPFFCALLKTSSTRGAFSFEQLMSEGML